MDDLTGLKPIAQGTSWTDQAIDIITIHGLQGYDTWEHPGHELEDSSTTAFWVRDFLPKDLPSANIFTYHYLPTVFCNGWGIAQAAHKLLSKLKNLLADNIEKSRPLVFICHSVGGLILQCALNKAFEDRGDTALNEVITATQGIIFLGTPHLTSELDITLSRIATASETTRSVIFDAQSMAQILVRFAEISQYKPPWKVVHCYEELPLPGTDFRAVDPSQEESWALPQLSLRSDHINLCRFISQDDVSYVKVLQSLKNLTSGLVSSVGDENEAQSTLSSIEHEVLESLETEDTSANIQDPAPGTCDWILEHSTYKSWLADPLQPLWITGKAGTGKTTLMKHIIEACRLESTSNQAVLSYFFSFRSANNSVMSLLSSLLHQLLKTTPSMRSFETFAKFHQRRENRTTDSARDIDILMENLLLLTDKSIVQGDSIFIIIDALDECEDHGKLDTILWRLSDFNNSRKLRICLSSRPSNISVPCAEICLEDNNSLDIQRYIGENLLALGSHLPLTWDVKQTTKTLAESARGMFLWASLVISQLYDDIHFMTIESEQRSTAWLPASLDAAYETIIQRLWNRHDETRRGMARDAFTLVLCAQRPLSILELRSALASIHYDPGLLCPLNNDEVSDPGIWSKMNKLQGRCSLDIGTQLRFLCGGLLQVVPRKAKFADETTDTESTVNFIHHTAREFLLERGSCVLEENYCASKLSFPELKPTALQVCNGQYHFRIASICLVYVDHIYVRCNHSNDESAIGSAPFLNYCLSFGMAHLSEAEGTGVNPMMKEMYGLSQFQPAFIDQWSLLHSRIFKDQRLFEPRKTKAVHIMSYYGLPWYDTGLWGARVEEVNEEDHYGRTPLSIAASMGHRHILKFLLDNGADIGHRDYVYGQTPLSQATAYGHKGVVELLLSAGADYDDNSSGVTPLWLAIRSGHRDIAELLLHAGASPKASSIHTGESCLSHAASLGDIKTARLLLNRGARVDTRDKNGWTPLHHAVSQGRKMMIELLLGFLKPQELFKIKEKLLTDKIKGFWVNTVLTAIVISACCQYGGEGQTGGSQNSQAPSTCSNGRQLRSRGNKPQKHKLGAGRDEDDNEESTRGNSEKRRRRLDPNGNRFACPYHKMNWTKFSSGPCNGKGFENIDRVKSHLKLIHDLSADWRRCHICKKRFLREKLDGHSPCVKRDLGDDYEDGYDLDQAQDLKSNETRPSKNPPESCWKAIFRVLFPNWPADRDTPNPYQANTAPTHCADALQQHRKRMMDQSNLSELGACRTDDERRQVLEALLGDLERDCGYTPATTDNLPPRPVSTQPSIVVSTQQPQYHLPPASQSTFTYSHGRRPQFHTPAVSSSDANSSRFLRSHDQSDTFTEGTAFSDQMSTGFESFGPHQSMASSRTLPQFHTERTITVAQPPSSTISHHPVSDLAVENEETAPDSWMDFLSDPQHQPQPVEGYPVQDDIQQGEYEETEMPFMVL